MAHSDEEDIIQAHATSNVPDQVFRGLRDERDLHHMVAVRAGCQAADRTDESSMLEHVPTVEALAQWLATAQQNDQGFDPARDLLFVEAHDQVIGYSQVMWCVERDGTHVYLHRHYLLPPFRGKDIERKTVYWAEERSREMAAQRSDSDSAVFGVNVSSSESQLLALLKAEGYTPLFHFVEMVFDDFAHLPEAALPEGLTVQPPEPEHYQAMWETIQEAYAGQQSSLPVVTEEDYRAFVNSPNNDLSLWHVAWDRDSDQIAGLVACEMYNNHGVITEVSVRPAWRQRGLATALLARELRTLHARGASSIRLHAPAEHDPSAPAFYQSIGFRPIKEHWRLRKPLS